MAPSNAAPTTALAPAIEKLFLSRTHTNASRPHTGAARLARLYCAPYRSAARLSRLYYADLYRCRASSTPILTENILCYILLLQTSQTCKIIFVFLLGFHIDTYDFLISVSLFISRFMHLI